MLYLHGWTVVPSVKNRVIKSLLFMSDQPLSHNLDQLSNHGNKHKCGTSRGEL